MDLWDWIGLVGLALVIGGVAAIYWPAAMILGGLCVLAVYYLQECSVVAHSAHARESEAE